MRSRRIEYIIAVALMGSSAAVLSGCGGYSGASPTPPPSTPSSDSSFTTATPSPVNTAGSSGSSLPPETFTFSLNGTGGKVTKYFTPTISTDNRLVVEIQANAAGPVSVPGTNFSANYNCASFQITVLGESVTTPALSVGSNGWMCPESAQQNYSYDFSARLGQGHNVVSVEVSNPEYDYYCYLYMWGEIVGTYAMYCPLHTVYQTHTINGQLSISTNGTQ